jgi:hypothetical protein
MPERNDPNQARSTRPSLFSDAQQAATGVDPILSNLEGGFAEKPKAPRRGIRRSALWGFGVGALLTAAGFAVWLLNDMAANRALETVAVSSRAAVKKAPLPNPAPTSVPATAILEEVAPVPAAAPDTPPGAAAKEEMLADIVTASAGPVHHTDRDARHKASKGAAAAARGKPRASIHGKAKKNREKKKAAATTSMRAAEDKRKAVPVKTRPDPEPDAGVDTDVALLTALVAHSRASTEAALKQCNLMTGSKAQQCRLRVCEGHKKSDPACQVPAKAAVPKAAGAR